mmetsp:Transcript_13015/g.16181  ORF Transcript_13015/g.16181 Transcript_13015/m.16181 type:complete len:129 (+) Transcript_13015:172-558(+)
MEDLYTPGQKDFAQKLRDNILKLSECYKSILLAAMVENDTASERKGLQLSVQAHNLVAGSQTLLDMITQLKLSLLTSNIEKLNEEVEKEKQNCLQACAKVGGKLDNLINQLDVALDELEQHYFQSEYH